MIAVLLAVLLFLLADSSVPSLEPYSIAMRALGALVAILPVVWRRRLLERRSSPKFSRAMIPVGIGFGIYLASSTVAHGNALAASIGFAGFLLAAALISVLTYYYSALQIVDGAYAALLLICIASLIAYRFQPELAVENFRLRGVMENANGLGFVGFALGSITLAVRRNAWQHLLGFSVALACLFLSGSRASMLALVIAVLGLAVGGVRPARWVIVMAAITTGITWLAQPGLSSSVLLFRATDTRSMGFEAMEDAMSMSFWTGLGEMPLETKAAGSLFAAGITGGIVGLVGLGLMYVGLLRNYATSRPRGLALVTAGVFHSLLESWMLSFSAPMLLVFLVVLMALASVDALENKRWQGRELDRGRSASFVLPRFGAM